MSFVKLGKVSKVYRLGDEVIYALLDVDLAVDEGEFIAMAGPSGSGKSTLLHIIGGLDRPTSGKAAVNGIDIIKADDQQLAKYRNEVIGFVFQTFNLHPTYNALENVALPLVFGRVPQKERIKRARTELEAVGLGNRADHLPNQLSGGERQRVAIARALVTQPRIILADEPTGNLDRKSGEQVIEILTKLNKEKLITLMLVTHNLDIAKLAPRVLYLADGRIAEEKRI